MKEIKCRFRAHFDSASQSHSRWFSWGHLPEAMQLKAVRRLGLLALFMAGASAIMFILFAVVMSPEHVRFQALYGGSGFGNLPPLLVLTLVGFSLVIVFLSRSRAIRPRRMLQIGTVYQLVAGLHLGLLHHIHTWEGFWIYTGWSGVAIWLIVFTMMVPTSPGRALCLALSTALCDPLALYFTVHMGAPMPSVGMQAMLFVPTGVAVAAAVSASAILHRMGRDIERAEGMGSYKLVEKLGQGGMGEVWRAVHNTLARPAAIKLIRPEALAGGSEDGATVSRRFEREAQATAQLKSDHAIELYDYGQQDDGTLYYVMELLEGVDLEGYVKRFGAMPAGRVVHILRQCCHSLAEAHAAGLVHRDIKPANIYLCRYGLDVDYVKVLDFGLVKRSLGDSSAGVEGTKLTMEGQISGTPAYMAPEVALGEESLDGRVDLYSLGCVAYWLVAGTTVFDAPTPIKMLLLHANEPPPPPSERPDCNLPAELEALILRCLAKDPEDRPQTAQELDAALAILQQNSDCRWSDGKAHHWWDAHLAMPADMAVPEAAESGVAPTIPMESMEPTQP